AASAGSSVLFRSKQTGTVGGSTEFTGATSSTPAAAPTQIPTQAQAETPIQAKDLPNVSVVLEEYGDYQCPPCGLLYPELKKIESEYGNQLQIQFHHFPLAQMHKNALAAARAAEAARNQNKFWEMHDRLYRNQKAWAELPDPRPMFVSYAQELGMNADRFTRDMDSPEVDQRISADQQHGASIGVTGTPTVFIDGHMLRAEATNPDG